MGLISQRLIALLGGVNDDQPFMHIHLGGRQPDTFGLVHGGQHVGNQCFDPRIDRHNGFGDGVQLGVRVAENRE